MSLSLPAIGGTARRAGDFALGVKVMMDRKLFNPLRLDHAARSFRNVSKFGPFAGVVMHAAQTRPDAGAIVDERGELTFGMLDEQSNALARGLRASGINEGDVVAGVGPAPPGRVLCREAGGQRGVGAGGV
ncbi:AMP-binding protein [Nocardia neocaledoniensis]|uniref:AMP-binding protein n=1 Tax=Nocardia neocaledoniensis TaxID=236511 RepID=UPI0024550321|nr:AMP-binding protein [Nocardia neocaledoniensis]